MMYKDRPEINQRSDSVYSQVLKEQALILKKYFDAHENKEILKEVFLPASELSVGNNKKTKLHTPKHERCSGIKKGTSIKLTEKRICRCMFYYCKKSVKCQNCLLIPSTVRKTINQVFVFLKVANKWKTLKSTKAMPISNIF